MRAINNLLGAQTLQHVTSLAGKPGLNMFLEEYFVALKK
jgi:hypothetical protein